MRTLRAFTLIEVVIVIFILMLVMMLAIPSFSGVRADQRLRRSLDSFNTMVQQAQERSLKEHRSYLIIVGPKTIELRPEALVEGDDPNPVAELPIERAESIKLLLPAALTKSPPPEWIFWPTGTCEPAIVQFIGRDGTWTANFTGLTARPELTTYAAH